MSRLGAAVFLDFDGTITLRDATDALLDAFADPAWLHVEAAWVAGRIGSRECLARQMALVTATQDQVDRLLDEIGVDPGLALLLEVCAAHAAPVHILSDGFDYCIARILGRSDLQLQAHLTNARIMSSCLRPDAGRWRATFPYPPEPCAHGCATCKPAAMEHRTAPGDVAVFVGDGLSDRYAAASADLVFAKDKLATFCDNASISYVSYDTLAAVADGLEEWWGVDQPLPGKVFPAT